MRIGLATLLTFVSFVATDCSKLGGSGSPTSPSGPPAAGSTVRYSALGASDVIGFGSSKPCAPFEDCNGNGYVWVAARQLRTEGFAVNVSSLGIPTTVISRTFADLGTQNGRTIVSNIIDGELPFVAKDSTLVTIFTGANEVNTITAAIGNGAAGTNTSAYVDNQVSTFASDFTTLLNGIRSRAPAARIIVLNVPNVGALPFLARDSTAQKQAAQRASVRMTNAINAMSGITVIDLMCDSRLYQASTFSPDGFHPNDNGYAILGAQLARAVSAASYPAPNTTCAQMTLF